MEIEFLRTNGDDPDFRGLVKLLDGYLAETDGEDHSFYDQFNKVDSIKYVVLAFDQGKAVACGAIKEFDPQSMEVKRMFVHPSFRGQGISKLVLGELERWATQLGFSRCVLETGKRQVEAIGLYLKSGYQVTPNYGQYIDMDNSVCFEKILESQQ